MDLATILSSGVLAGLVAGLVTLRTTERKIAIENITQQRQVWREKIREIANQIHARYRAGEKNNVLAKYIELQLLLNPNDIDDKSILDTLWLMASEESQSELDVEFAEKLSLLLKHDWDRAKNEAKPFWFHLRSVQRVSYSDFKFKRNQS